MKPTTIASYLVILLYVFTLSCLHGDDPEWELQFEIKDADGCTTSRYKMDLSDRVEYKEVVLCPNGESITDTWTEYK